MKHVLPSVAALLTLATPAAAATVNGFTQDYAVSNWTTSAPVGGSVDTSGAPSTITLIEPNSGSGGDLDFTIQVAETGTISFDYTYGGTDFGWGEAGTLLNGVETTLPGATLVSSASPSTLSALFTVNAGDTFGFFSSSVDGIFGSTTLGVSNFQAIGIIAPVPLPPALLMLLAALGGLTVMRRRTVAA